MTRSMTFAKGSCGGGVASVTRSQRRPRRIRIRIEYGSVCDQSRFDSEAYARPEEYTARRPVRSTPRGRVARHRRLSRRLLSAAIGAPPSDAARRAGRLPVWQSVSRSAESDEQL